MANHLFSSAVLRIGAPGNSALNSANVVAVDQDISLDVQFGRHDLFDAAQNSIFAVDTADHEGKASVKFSNKDVAAAILQYAAGTTSASGTVGGNPATIYTLGQLSKPAYCRLEFDAIDTNGKNVHFIATKAKLRGYALAAKLTDFADTSLEADLYPDPLAATAGTVFTFSVDN